MLIPLTFDAPPAAFLRLSVVIPARDEADLLPQTLAALAAQTDLLGRPLDPALYEILVLANNCRDETASATRAFASEHPWLALHVAERRLPPACANVGSARRLLMDAARRRLLSCGALGGVIASTDGDTRVASDWVAQTLREIDQGADAVGGRIFVDRHEDAGARRYHLCDVAYHHLTARLESLLDPDEADPWPRHHQFFGGSLALTTAAYDAVGGLPAVSCLEDVALGRALIRNDVRLRHSTRVRVTTSARQCGRTERGLATQLREWSGMASAQGPHRVQAPAALEARFLARVRLRRLWGASRAGHTAGSRDVARLAHTLCVPTATLVDALARPCRPFGMLWEPVQLAHEAPDGRWARRWPLLPIATAISELRASPSARTCPAGSAPRAGR